MGPEANFSKKVMKRLSWIENCFVVRTQAGSIRGIPDLIICCKGKFYAWELKVDHKPTKLQQHTLKQIHEAGGAAFVVTPRNLEAHVDMMCEFTGAIDTSKLVHRI